MNKQRATATSVLGLMIILVFSIFWVFNQKTVPSNREVTDEALLALIKNDLGSFENFINAGGSVHDHLPLLDNKIFTVAQGIAYFERTTFATYLERSKISYVKQDAEALFDIVTLAVKKNNPELFAIISHEKPAYNFVYGDHGWSLLHMASDWCSDKLIRDLHGKGSITWASKAKDGATPLTLAAESECLPVLFYYKEIGADFRAKDGRGKSALAILHDKKGAAFSAFAASFENRTIAAVTVMKEAKLPDFYKKRKIPKDQIVDHSAMLGPEDRPLGAIETAENSEFAD